MKLIDGNKEEEASEEKRAVFTTGIGLYGTGKDFDIKINDHVVMWFNHNGVIECNKESLEDEGFKLSDDFASD